MSKVKTRTADQPLRRLLVPAAALSLSAAFVVGAGAVSAQDDSIDGTWTVDTSIGSIDDGSGTFVGFRVAEVLDPGGEKVAVGRTPDVSGQIDVAGTVIESFAIEADLTTLATDNNFRNGAIQRTLQTGDFPTASFVSTESVDLGQVPPEGEVFAVSVPGTLTIRDVSQDMVVDLEAGRGGDTVVVVGTWPIEFGDFDVTMPSAPIVVSVSESGELEWQVFFTRESEMAVDPAAEDMGDDPAEGSLRGITARPARVIAADADVRGSARPGSTFALTRLQLAADVTRGDDGATEAVDGLDPQLRCVLGQLLGRGHVDLDLATTQQHLLHGHGPVAADLQG